MVAPIRRAFRPPPSAPSAASQVLGYANPQVEREIARRWRRHHFREWSYKAGAILTVMMLIGIWIFLRLFFGIRIVIIRF